MRKVRGGVRLRSKALPLDVGWSGRLWVRGIARLASERRFEEGFALVGDGCVKSIMIQPGRIVATVQERVGRPATVVMQLEPYDDTQWEPVIQAFAQDVGLGTRLLAGECPEAVGGVFEEQSLALGPKGEEDLLTTSSCDDRNAWCVHVCAVALVAAEMIDDDPRLLFTLRGLPAQELVERIRHIRTDAVHLEQSGAGAPLATSVDLDRPRSAPLEQCFDHFWDTTTTLEELDTTPRRAEVSHALLRRLGPSPFESGRFPLVGLLATCYDVISGSILTGSHDQMDAD